MDTKNNRKMIVGARWTCLAAGILSLICAIYWIIQGFLYGKTNLLLMLSSVCTALYLLIFSHKRKN